MKKNIVLILAVISVIILVFILWDTEPSSSSKQDSRNANNKKSSDRTFNQENNNTLIPFAAPSADQTTNRRRQRELTPEQKRENREEFARMRKEIPGNMFIPGELSENEQQQRRDFTRKIILLGNKVRNGKATTEEKKEYYSMRSKEVEDKIEFAEYIIKRVKEKNSETGRDYLPERILQRSTQDMEKLNEELQTYTDKLKAL